MSACSVTGTAFIAKGGDGYQAGTFVQMVQCATCQASFEFLMPAGAVTKETAVDVAELTRKWKTLPPPKGDEKDYRPVCAR